MSEFAPHDPALEKIVRECVDPSELQSRLAEYYQRRGYEAPPPASNHMPAASSASGGFEFEREIKFAPSTGRRTLVIRAHTLEDLDALEHQILGY
jgi:hypothetical protein